MSTRERVLVFGALAALLTVNLVVLFGRSGSDPWSGSAAWAAPSGAGDRMGPAETLTLVSDTASKDVVLRNGGGRLAWSESVHDRAYSVGYVFIGKVLGPLMQQEMFVEGRDALIEELNEQEATYRERLEEIMRRGQGLDQGSEEFKQTFEEFNAAREDYGKWQQEAITRRGRLDAEQLERAYRELVAAVEIVAERKGIDTVYRFIPTEDPFNAENPEQALLAIRLRTAIQYPDELDITRDVMEELSVEEE